MSTTKSRSALLFTFESWLPSSFFLKCERSVYGGNNSLNIEAIDRQDGSYEWISCNHVLEHVKHDKAALSEMLRVLSSRGIAQITVPTPSMLFRTEDWGKPDENFFNHYRNYGADFIEKIQDAAPNASILVVFATDTISPWKDMIYFMGKDYNEILSLGAELAKSRYLCVPIKGRL